MKIPAAPRYIISLVVFGTLLLMGGIPPGIAEEIPGSEAAAEQIGEAPATLRNAPASKVYIDPVTGEFTAPPRDAITPLAAEELSPELQNALSTRSSDLTPVLSSRPGGGVMVDLKGRFQKGSMAVRNPDGSFSVRPVLVAPAAAE